MKLFGRSSCLLFWILCYTAAGMRKFQCKKGEALDTLSTVVANVPSISQCSALCSKIACPSFAFRTNSQQCTMVSSLPFSVINNTAFTRCFEQQQQPTTTSTSTPSTTTTKTTLTTAMLTGDDGSLCSLSQFFTYIVPTTGATFRCCHGWEYLNAINKDRAFLTAVTAAQCQLKCDADVTNQGTCWSFVYYTNSTCQMSTCRSETTCTKTNMAGTLWCYYD